MEPKAPAPPEIAAVAPPVVVAAASAARPEDAPEPEGAPVSAVASAAHGGRLDVAELRRRWPDVIRAMKEVRPTSSKMFLDTEADLDGDEVVVEFDSSRKVFKRMAEDAEVTALLRTSIERVLGWRVSVRHQLGRGAVRPADGTATESGTSGRLDADDLDRVLVEGLGAEVVSEHRADEEGGTLTR
jgi:hypothetical protein